MEPFQTLSLAMGIMGLVTTVVNLWIIFSFKSFQANFLAEQSRRSQQIGQIFQAISRLEREMLENFVKKEDHRYDLDKIEKKSA